MIMRRILSVVFVSVFLLSSLAFADGRRIRKIIPDIDPTYQYMTVTASFLGVVGGGALFFNGVAVEALPAWFKTLQQSAYLGFSSLMVQLHNGNQQVAPLNPTDATSDITDSLIMLLSSKTSARQRAMLAMLAHDSADYLAQEGEPSEILNRYFVAQRESLGLSSRELPDGAIAESLVALDELLK